MATKKSVLGPHSPLSDDLHPECSTVTFEMKANGTVHFQYTHTPRDVESKRRIGSVGAAKIRDLTRPPGSSESKYDDLRTAAVATAVAAWFRKKHGEVADETNDDAPASLRSEAPASSPGKLPADDAAMDETLSGTASPTRETTPAQSAAPEQEASHDDDDGCLEDMRLSARNDEGEAGTSTPYWRTHDRVLVTELSLSTAPLSLFRFPRLFARAFCRLASSRVPGTSGPVG